VVNGWKIFAHSLFLNQLESLVGQVEDLRDKDPKGYVRKNPTKRLTAILKLAFEVIPQDPTRPDYRQGNTLGGGRKHWFRAKFFQQYRLFFRFHQESRIIVYAWVNDAQTRRAYGATRDAYRVFQKMLEKGRPPEDWDALLSEAREESGRLSGLFP
jgi:toxin YhaV